jgi:protein TonB
MSAAPAPRRITALGVSFAIHAALALALLVWAGVKPEPVATKEPPIRTDLVYLQTTGSGGGGGGRPTPAPPAKLQIPEHRQPALAVEAVTVPVDPPPVLDAPVRANSTILQGSGIAAFAPPGPGGGGPGTGVGPGTGPGVGPGDKGGAGDGQKGNGAVTPPVPIRQAKAAYTPAALAAKVMGSVTLEVEVLANGTVGNVKVLRSLDRVYGLDQEAIRAARQWLFIPGTSGGKPVDVIVQLILDFNLR